MSKFISISGSLYPIKYLERFEKCNVGSIIIGFDKEHIGGNKDNIYSFNNEKEAAKVYDKFTEFINNGNLYGVFKLN